MSIDILVMNTHPPGAFLEVVLGCDRGIVTKPFVHQRSLGCYRGMATEVFFATETKT